MINVVTQYGKIFNQFIWIPFPYIFSLVLTFGCFLNIVDLALYGASAPQMTDAYAEKIIEFVSTGRYGAVSAETIETVLTSKKLFDHLLLTYSCAHLVNFIAIFLSACFNSRKVLAIGLIIYLLIFYDYYVSSLLNIPIVFLIYLACYSCIN